MDLTYATATDLVTALRSGAVSSRELLDHVVARIESTNPALNAVVTLDVEAASEAAGAADERQSRGDPLGPLHGLVMTVKDVWETAGLRTTSGAPELADHVPAADAITVARLRAAGAVIVGKTNTPLYAGDHQTFNDVFGQTNNPWDTAMSPSGSSGGAAAAVAAGMVALELGSDIGGSIRSPSHCCGTHGLKPTWGVVPSRGHIPGPPGSLVEADVNAGGPMARSVEDLRLGLDVLAGPLPEDATAWQLTLPDDPTVTDLRGMRFGVTLDDPDFPVARDVQAVLRSLVEAVADAGAEIVETTLPVPMTEAVDTWSDLVLPMIGMGLPPEVYDALAVVPFTDDPAARAMARLTYRFRDRAIAVQRRQQHRRTWATAFESFDAWLLPTWPVASVPHDHRPTPEREFLIDGQTRTYLDLVAWPGAIGAMLLPAVTIPAGLTPAGLPVGVQIVGPHLQDHRLLRIAGLADAVGPGFVAPPGY